MDDPAGWHEADELSSTGTHLAHGILGCVCAVAKLFWYCGQTQTSLDKEALQLRHVLAVNSNNGTDLTDRCGGAQY
eukprot:jgi/Chrzof1/239/Cz01g08120.t1